MTISPVGTIFYQDADESGGAFYRVEWETVGDQLDITTTTSIPYVWGEENKGYVLNGLHFRYGMISITRQILKPIEDGYEIVAEGNSQYQDYIQMNFPCQIGPSDNFLYHLNCGVSDFLETRVVEGPHWTDPSELTDDVIWAELDSFGNPIIGSTFETLQWIDVWVE
jgi:hypothetical protein